MGGQQLRPTGHILLRNSSVDVMLHISAVRIPLGESRSYFERILDLSSIPRGTFGHAGYEVFFGKFQNAFSIHLKTFVPFFEELEVDFPDLFGLPLV
jgi:hypothetical protein